MRRVSVSDIQTFHRYRTNDDIPLGVVIRDLKRLDPPTEQMDAGTDLHAILEFAEEYTDEAGHLTLVATEDFVFDFQELDHEIALPLVRELRGNKVYVIDGEEIDVRGRVDGTNGVMVSDTKLKTTSGFDAEKYEDSYQWRFYLDIFNVRVFRYDVFIGKLENREDRTDVILKDFHQLTLYRYPELEDDLRNELTEFVRFAREYLWT